LSISLLNIYKSFFIMLSFVYLCEKSTSKLRFLVSCALDENLNVLCPECEQVRRFILFRRNTGNGLVFKSIHCIQKEGGTEMACMSLTKGRRKFLKKIP
jgi:hypothetical protein